MRNDVAAHHKQHLRSQGEARSLPTSNPPGTQRPEESLCRRRGRLYREEGARGIELITERANAVDSADSTFCAIPLVLIAVVGGNVR